MTKSVFSKILAGELEASFVYQGNAVSAFLDIAPFNPGHTLVVPNEEYSSISTLPPDLAAELFCVAQRVALAIRKTDLKCEGINFLMSDGEAAGQEVPHCHLHVIPRYIGDGFSISHVAAHELVMSRRELNICAKKIRANLGELL